MHIAAPTLLAVGTIDWLYQLTQQLTDLTTANGDALSNFGMILLAFLATLKLIGVAIRMSPWSAYFGGYRPVSLDELKVFLFRLLFCCVIEHYWTNNLPGAAFGFNRMFSYIAGAISQILDQNSLNQLLQLMHTAASDTTLPTGLAIYQYVVYFLIMILMGLASGILFLINSSAFIFYGVTALFGPVLIPLYMTETFRGKFLHFVEVLASFAMIRAVAAAFIFVWSGFLTGFMQQTFEGNYSLANWLANLVPFMTIYVAFILNMVLVPSITQIIFGGGAGAAGKIGEMGERVAAYAVTRS
ncbi:hypothetical protein ACPOL_6770 (plasmid) [Acidisarcina polymorpha]|uniref:Uncharacterized protein n=1 Tax=Acidisarcina polymorpha TaxID=2211140 RepID=A0A2Z5GAP0_9BACT|nr:hypothetical protein [Acidisarcina polymorpha]AXC15980.1 hypothetical protein ACPOL_6770 [Acidisarcina polymorpha]